MLGQILGDYEIQQEIGRGPSATVYTARQHPVERYVAVKLFEPQSREVTARLKELYALIEQLDHTHLLPIYDQGRWQDRHYWVTRYMPAGSLKTRLSKQRLTLEEIDRVLPQIASALDHAHGHGVIHGDLKLTDVLIDHAGQAFVTDFGAALALNRSAALLRAPEVWRGSVPDVRTDVYGLGAILYELLTLRQPIEPAAPNEERANRRLVPPAPSTLNSKLPHALDDVVLKALAVDPDQRYQTPSDLIDAYVQARTTRKGAPVMAAAASAATDSRVRRVSAHRTEPQRTNRWRLIGLFIGGVLGVLFIIGLLGGLLLPPGASNPTAPLFDSSPPTATHTPIVTLTRTPEPSATPTKPAATATPRPTSTATPAATLTATATVAPTRAATRVLPTATPTISIAPLTLAIPRRETRDSLQLTFSTNVQPAEAGIIGTLSMEVPAVEPLVIDRVLAQVGSGDQVLRVGVSINCGSVVEPITSQQVVVALRDAAGQTLLTQTLDYTKRWCQ
jgi:serine/threonine protein kinase